MSDPTPVGPPSRPPLDSTAADLRDLAARVAVLDRVEAVALLRRDQQRRWQHGDFLSAETYIRQVPALADSELAVDLIYSEVLLRERAGEKATLDEYLRRFPQFEQALRLQFAVHEALPAEVMSRPPEQETVASAGITGSFVILSQRPAGGSSHGPNAWPTIPGYEIQGVLGRGGMGVVYKAKQTALKRLVALKVVRAGTAADAHDLMRFRHEAEAVARLRHPNIVQIYDVGEWRAAENSQAVPFFSLEFVEGGSLRARLAETPQPPRTAAHIVEQLARAVQVAHQSGVVHRDLKPANILLAGSVDTPLMQCQPKIGDFGLAKQLDVDSGHTHSGAILGTPNYMAPEQAAGETRQVGPLADVYALGAILYEMLTGRPTFQGPTVWNTLEQVRKQPPLPPRRLVPGVPHDLETICLKCLEKEPQRRYASALDLAEDLRAYLMGDPIQARPLTTRERLQRWIQQRPATALLAAGAAVGIAALAVGSLWFHVLAFSLVAGLSLLGGGGWYYLRLRAALRELAAQNLVAERQVQRLHLLLEMTHHLMSVTDLDALLRLIGETTTRLVNAERATIFLIDRPRHELWSKVALGEGLGEIRLPLGSGIAGAVAVNGETVLLPDAYADPRFNKEVDRQTGYRTRNLLAIAMKAQDGRILGVFQVLNKRGGAFVTEDAELLTALAASAAVAVDQAQRVQEGGR